MCVVTGTSGTLNADVPMITAVCLGEVKLRDGPGSLKQWRINSPLPDVLGSDQTCKGNVPPRPHLESVATHRMGDL